MLKVGAKRSRDLNDFCTPTKLCQSFTELQETLV